MKYQDTLDKSAMGLSFLCLAHCMILPVVTVLLPTMLALTLEDEIFHRILLIGIVPLSGLALFMGCQKHRYWSVFAWGVTGLSILIFAAFFGHEVFGEQGEKAATAVGSLLIVVCHYKNYRQCGRHDCAD